MSLRKWAFGLLLFIGFLFFLGLSLGSPPLLAEGEEADGAALQKAQQLWGTDGARLTRMSLQECIDWALQFNREIKAADYSIAEIMEKKNDASKIGHPIANYEYDVAPAPQRVDDALASLFSGDITVFNRVKVEFGIPLYTFGKVKAGKELADQGIAAEREQKEKKKAEIASKVTQIYYGIELAREARRLIETARNQVRDEIKKHEEKEEGSDPSELLKLKLFRAELDKRFEEGNQREIMALEAMHVLLGLDQGARFDIASSQLVPIAKKVARFEDYAQLADEHRSDLKLLDIGTQAKAQELKLEKRLMTPNLGVGGFFELGRAPKITGVSSQDDFTNPFNFTRVGIGFQLKGDFDYHHAFSKVRQLESQLHRTELLREHAKQGINLEIKEAYLGLHSAKEALDRSDEAGKLSRQLLFLTQSNYDIGLAEPKEMIDAISGFLQRRGEYFEAVFNYNVAWAKLHEKVGLIPKKQGEKDES